MSLNLRNFSGFRVFFIHFLSNQDKKTLIRFVIAGCLNSVLDLVGILLIATIVKLSYISINGGELSGLLAKLIEIKTLDQVEFQLIVAILGLSAAIFFILKSIISLWLLKRGQLSNELVKFQTT